MKKYLMFTIWLVAILILGVLENTVFLPVFSIGLLLFLSKNSVWWLRVIAFVLAAVVWGSAMAVEPFVLLIILAVGYWVDRWLSQKIPTSQSLLIIVGATALTIGLIRQTPISLLLCVTFVLQMIAFSICSRYLPKIHAPMQFSVPVRSLRKVGDDA